MTTEMIKKGNKKNALERMADRLDLSPAVLTDTLKKTAFAACKTNEQFVSAVMVANTYGLNPILKEMSVFVGSGGSVIPVLMVDGWIKIVSRQKNFDGVDLVENKDESGSVVSLTAKMYVKDRSHPVVVTEYMSECKRSTPAWDKWPIRMLRHKAYIQAARLAFGIAGVYDEDEKDRIIEAERASNVSPIVEIRGAVEEKASNKPLETRSPETHTDVCDAGRNGGGDKPANTGGVSTGDVNPPFYPSSSKLDNTPVATLKDEIRFMLDEISGHDAAVARDLLRECSGFKSKQTDQMVSVSTVDDKSFSDKWVAFTHIKVKEKYNNLFEHAAHA